MLAFHEKVFDRQIIGTGSVYSGDDWNAQLGRWPILILFVKARQISGTLPTISVYYESSGDGSAWETTSALANVPFGALALSSEPTLGVARRPYDVEGALGRLRVVLGGAAPAAYVEVWATGRSDGRRALGTT